ncbi:MAG: hypothetical protein U0793_30855 [Gemmataceae bacterium]
MDKKKEVLEISRMRGQTYRPKGQPEKVKTHDFPDPKLGKAITASTTSMATKQACRLASAGRIRGGGDSSLVEEALGPAGIPGAGHIGNGRQRRQQRFALPVVEGRIAEVGRQG